MSSRTLRKGCVCIPLLAFGILVGCAENGPTSDSTLEEGSQAEAIQSGQEDVADYFELVEYCRQVLLSDPYFESFVGAVLDKVSLDLEPPYSETAIISVTLGPVGYVENLELKSVTSPVIEAPIQLFIEAPPSLPRAPRNVRDCLGPRPFPLVVQVVENFHCMAQPKYVEYKQEVARRFYKILYSSPFSGSPGYGWVNADLTLGSEGHIRKVEIRGGTNPRTAAKLRRAAERIGTLPAPPEFSRCFASKSLRLRVEVQGNGLERH